MDDLQYLVPKLSNKLFMCFKPYYKWMTFNTIIIMYTIVYKGGVLNLIINGWPSILYIVILHTAPSVFVLNLIINGWPSIPDLDTSFIVLVSQTKF